MCRNPPVARLASGFSLHSCADAQTCPSPFVLTGVGGRGPAETPLKIPWEGRTAGLHRVWVMLFSWVFLVCLFVFSFSNSTGKQGPFLGRCYFEHPILDERVVWLYCVVEMRQERMAPGNELAHSPGTNQFLMLCDLRLKTTSAGVSLNTHHSV